MRLVAEVLDQQLVDRDQRKIGKVDGLVLELRDGERPRVVAIEVGAAVLAARLGRRWERLVLALNRRLGVCREPRYRIAWRHVTDIGVDIGVDIDGKDKPPLDWERWIRDRILSKIPFA